MKTYSKCLKCDKEGLTVPLTREENGWVCSLCGTTYQNIKS